MLVLEDRTTDPTIRWICSAVNWFVWLAFMGEYVMGLSVATSRAKFATESWFDLAIIVVSPPFLVPEALQNMRGLRALRIFRLLRLVGERQTFILESLPVSETCSIALATSNSAMFLVLDSLTQYIHPERLPLQGRVFFNRESAWAWLRPDHPPPEPR